MIEGYLTIMHSSTLIQTAISMRKSGQSYKSISKELGISVSTAYSWVSRLVLSDIAKSQLEKKKKEARNKGLNKIAQNRGKVKQELQVLVNQDIRELNFSGPIKRISTALLFWGEGGKTDSALSFMNSDPDMVKVFLSYLRSGWSIDESKFRIKVHLHAYHDQEKTLAFWSNKTQIPLGQFSRPYIKKSTGKTRRKGYMGCITIRYYDVTIAHQLKMYLQQITLNIGP